jgi:hypothetical protein
MMPNYDSYLYANGALRLTRHGDRAGGTVLVLTTCGKQFSVCDAETRDLTDEIVKLVASTPDAEDVFDTLADWFRDIYPKVA